MRCVHTPGAHSAALLGRVRAAARWRAARACARNSRATRRLLAGSTAARTRRACKRAAAGVARHAAAAIGAEVMSAAGRRRSGGSEDGAPSAQARLRTFGEDAANISKQDFLTFDAEINFDLIVANPPYAKLLPSGKRASKNHNLIGLFINKSLSILRKNGFILYITPDNWMSYADRNTLILKLTEMQIHHINHLAIQHTDSPPLENKQSPCRT